MNRRGLRSRIVYCKDYFLEISAYRIDFQILTVPTFSSVLYLAETIFSHLMQRYASPQIANLACGNLILSNILTMSLTNLDTLYSVVPSLHEIDQREKFDLLKPSYDETASRICQVYIS